MGNTKVKNIAIIAAAFCLLGTGVLAQSHSGCYSYPDSDAAQILDNTGINCTMPSGGNRSENQAFIGVVLSLDKGEVHPKISAGLRHILVEGNDHVTGGEINFSTAPTDISQTTVRVLALTGKRDIMANIGLGYDLADNSILVNGGVQVPYLRASVDYKPKNAAFKPQIEVNSYGKIAPAGAGCDGIVLSPTQIMQQLVAKQILVYTGSGMDPSGDIFNGSLSTNFGVLPVIGYQNLSVFNTAGDTCLNLTEARPQELNANLVN